MEPILLTRPGSADPQPLADYQGEGGYEALSAAVKRLPEHLLSTIERSGLRGRGGAGFPVGQKWRLAASEAETQKYVVANGGEDEPGSAKDRVLMESYPHRVLEGVILAAYAIGAHEAVLYVNSLYDHATAMLDRAITEASAAGFLGARVAGSAFNLAVRIQSAPQEYVAGEDSAVLEVIEGGPPLPREKPPFPTSAGLHGKPTVVNNIETFAFIPTIVRRGPDWFRGQGTADNPGTMLFTLPSNVRSPGVVELPIGISLRVLIEDYGGGLASGKAIKAVLPGGPSSAFIGGTDLDVAMDRQPLAALGSALGCGILRIIEAGECLVEVVDGIAHFFQKESCGQCPICQMETQALARITAQVRDGQGSQQMLDQIPKLGAFARGKGFCGLISMPIPPLTSAIRLFPEDFAYHIEHGHCPASEG
ncbi:MAG: NADH-quinone oxidoreductase subunit F [Chloroflexi bacterium]|nr:NADH-quinone oxidoreductase subunit F [Chloroflexota bacterium]